MHQQLNGSSEGKNVRINTGFLKLSGQKRTTKRVNKTYAVFGDIIKRNNLWIIGVAIGEERRRQWHLTPVLLPGKSQGWRSLVGLHGVAKSWTRLSDFTFTFHFHALEKDMATHSSVLAWRIRGMGEPGGPLSMGSHRVGHDWSDLAAAGEEK